MSMASPLHADPVPCPCDRALTTHAVFSAMRRRGSCLSYLPGWPADLDSRRALELTLMACGACGRVVDSCARMLLSTFHSIPFSLTVNYLPQLLLAVV